METISEDNKILFENMDHEINMKTKVWGPPTWFFLHSMALAYPKKIDHRNKEHVRIKNGMSKFLNNLGVVLPCTMCGYSYEKYIRHHNLLVDNYLDSRADLFLFIWLIHEKVNDKLGVPKCDRLSFNDTIKYYYKFRAQGEIQCSETTEEERLNSLLTGCNEKDIKLGHSKKYKSSVVVIDENDKNDKKEYLENHKNNNNNSLNKILLILLLVFLIIIIILLILLKKKYNS